MTHELAEKCKSLETVSRKAEDEALQFDADKKAASTTIQELKAAQKAAHAQAAEHESHVART